MIVTLRKKISLVISHIINDIKSHVAFLTINDNKYFLWAYNNNLEHEVCLRSVYKLQLSNGNIC